MNADKIVIKQIPDEYAGMTGLDKHGRSKMPNTVEFLQPAIGPDGRVITGIDEDALSISQLPDAEEREALRAEKKALREQLELKLGKKLDALSEYWDTFGIALSANSDLILNKTNPLHQLFYHVLVANHYAAPDFESSSRPEYRNAKYYCYVAERVDKQNVSTQKQRDKARARLLELSDVHEKMVLVGQFLEGDKYKLGMEDDTLYKMLSDYINSTQEPDNLKRFLKACDTDVEEMQFKITVDRAIKKKIIRYNAGYYQLGQTTLGKTPADVVKNLKTPEFASEFLQIKDEVEP